MAADNSSDLIWVLSTDCLLLEMAEGAVQWESKDRGRLHIILALWGKGLSWRLINVNYSSLTSAGERSPGSKKRTWCWRMRNYLYDRVSAFVSHLSLCFSLYIHVHVIVIVIVIVISYHFDCFLAFLVHWKILDLLYLAICHQSVLVLTLLLFYNHGFPPVNFSPSILSPNCGLSSFTCPIKGLIIKQVQQFVCHGTFTTNLQKSNALKMNSESVDRRIKKRYLFGVLAYPLYICPY